MHVAIAQIPTTLDVDVNASRALEIIRQHAAADLIVFPEASLSGYTPPFADVDTDAVERAIERVDRVAQEASTTAICGAILRRGGSWVNAAIAVGTSRGTYQKANLASAERGRLTAGDALPVLGLAGARIGVQICRELRYPEQWRALARAGAQLFVHLNNAHDESGAVDTNIWRSMLVSRATESQRYVLSANAAGPGQRVPSLAVDPSGAVIHESRADAEDVFEVEVDLARVSDVYLDQARDDLG